MKYSYKRRSPRTSRAFFISIFLFHAISIYSHFGHALTNNKGLAKAQDQIINGAKPLPLSENDKTTEVESDMTPNLFILTQRFESNEYSKEVFLTKLEILQGRHQLTTDQIAYLKDFYIQKSSDSFWIGPLCQILGLNKTEFYNSYVEYFDRCQKWKKKERRPQYHSSTLLINGQSMTEQMWEDADFFDFDYVFQIEKSGMRQRFTGTISAFAAFVQQEQTPPSKNNSQVATRPVEEVIGHKTLAFGSTEANEDEIQILENEFSSLHSSQRNTALWDDRSFYQKNKAIIWTSAIIIGILAGQYFQNHSLVFTY